MFRAGATKADRARSAAAWVVAGGLAAGWAYYDQMKVTGGSFSAKEAARRNAKIKETQEKQELEHSK